VKKHHFKKDFQIQPQLDITVVILTYNEARHIERCINSIKHIANDILVVDSYSTDYTTNIAKSLGARVLQNKFISHSNQFQWGIDNGTIETEWIMRLDADEIIESDLIAEIRKQLPFLPDNIVGVNFDRKHIFMGRWVKHGGRYPIRLLRLWRRGKGRVEDRWMDEHIVVWGGETVTMKGGFSDANENDLTFFTDKHNKYASREAIDVLINKYSNKEASIKNNIEKLSKKNATKRWFKEHFYNKLPFWVGPFLYFIYRYFMQLGFLDGRSGLIYHFLQGFWYRFLVGAKIAEFEMLISNCKSNSEKIDKLFELSGLKSH